MRGQLVDKSALDQAVQEFVRGEGTLAEIAERRGLRKGTLSTCVDLLRNAPQLYARVMLGEIGWHQAKMMKRDPNYKTVKEQRKQKLREVIRMAKAGHHSEEIGQVVGMHPETVRQKLRQAGVAIAEPAFLRQFDVRRVVEQTAIGLSGYAMGAIQATDAAIRELPPGEAGEFSEQITESLAVLRALARRLAFHATNQPKEVGDNVPKEV